MHPTIFLDPQFTLGVMAGWILTVLGVGALLLGGIWFSLAGEWRGGSARPPGAFRALIGLGLVFWLGGLLWQFVGYWKTGTLSW
ncbi:MAG TPA: hypothetical protein VL086_07070 [Candidatus Nitrosotalea sp.]|jgi:hypothetical protein|nr:hypothetical protein [Candidatus Nitrosotalea sp.]